MTDDEREFRDMLAKAMREMRDRIKALERRMGVTESGVADLQDDRSESAGAL